MKKIIFFLVFAFLIVFSIYAGKFYILQLTMQTEKMKEISNDLNNACKRTEYAVDELKSIKRLETFAVETLNLHYPEGMDYESDNKKYAQRD